MSCFGLWCDCIEKIIKDTRPIMAGNKRLNFIFSNDPAEIFRDKSLSVIRTLINCLNNGNIENTF